jgi:hypothetical protein
VLVTDNTIKGKRSETIMRFGAVTEEMLSNPVYGFRVLTTPDVIYSDELDVDKYESWMTMLLVKITDSKGKTKVYYKWYIPIFSSE